MPKLVLLIAVLLAGSASAVAWVTELERPIFAVAKVEGNLCSMPLKLRIRRADDQAAKRQAAAVRP